MLVLIADELHSTTATDRIPKLPKPRDISYFYGSFWSQFFFLKVGNMLKMLNSLQISTQLQDSSPSISFTASESSPI